jgi:Flp pilus assembly pilin Flp
MRNLFLKLWKDDEGIVALEYLLVATIVGLGLVVGLANLEGALNAELTELANAISALSQGYVIGCQSGCKATKDGHDAIDRAGHWAFGYEGPFPCFNSFSDISDKSQCNP